MGELHKGLGMSMQNLSEFRHEGGVMGDERPIPPLNASRVSFMQPVSREESDQSNWRFANEFEPLKANSPSPLQARPSVEAAMEDSLYRLRQDGLFGQGYSNLSSARDP